MKQRKWLAVMILVGAAACLSGSAQPPQDERAQRYREQFNAEAIRPTVELREWRGLKCTVHFRADVNPRAGVESGYNAGVLPSGLGHKDGVAMYARGVLADVGGDAVVVSGENGHVWIPRDDIRAIEVWQAPPTGKSDAAERGASGAR
jgi:hypothetical protein